MSASHLEALFPALAASQYSVTSPQDRRYNCIAWSAGNVRAWWWPAPGGYWPPGLPRALSVESFVRLFGSLGYAICDDDVVEEGFEKVALYVGADGMPSHVARQLPSGSWTSKLGRLEDIEHASPDGVCGDQYGSVGRIFRRRVGR